jgi:hypothetical protein
MMPPHEGGPLLKRSLYYLHDPQHDWLRSQAYGQRTTASAIVRLAIARLQADVNSGAVTLGEELAKQEAGP